MICLTGMVKKQLVFTEHLDNNSECNRKTHEEILLYVQSIPIGWIKKYWNPVFKHWSITYLFNALTSKVGFPCAGILKWHWAQGICCSAWFRTQTRYFPCLTEILGMTWDTQIIPLISLRKIQTQKFHLSTILYDWSITQAVYSNTGMYQSSLSTPTAVNTAWWLLLENATNANPGQYSQSTVLCVVCQRSCAKVCHGMTPWESASSM